MTDTALGGVGGTGIIHWNSRSVPSSVLLIVPIGAGKPFDAEIEPRFPTYQVYVLTY